MHDDAMFSFDGGPLAGEMWSLPFFTKIIAVEEDGEQHVYGFSGSRPDLADPLTATAADGTERDVTVMTQVLAYKGVAPRH